MMSFYELLIDKIKGKVPKGAKRSSKWRKLRQEFLKKQPVCQVCLTKKKLEVHHIIPFQINSSLELEESNLITLCRDHHLLFGHLDNYRGFNLDIINDIEIWRDKIQRQRELLERLNG